MHCSTELLPQPTAGIVHIFRSAYALTLKIFLVEFSRAGSPSGPFFRKFSETFFQLILPSNADEVAEQVSADPGNGDDEYQLHFDRVSPKQSNRNTVEIRMENKTAITVKMIVTTVFIWPSDLLIAHLRLNRPAIGKGAFVRIRFGIE